MERQLAGTTSGSRAALAILTTALSVWAVLRCSNSTPTSNNNHVPTTLVVSPDSVSLVRFDSAHLTASVLDQDSALISGAAITFQSSNTTLATVTPTGVVHSAGPSGKTTIVVSSGALHRNVPVTITTIPSAILLAPKDTAIHQGGSFVLRAVVVDSFGDSVANAPRTYQSTDTSVATISATGLVVGHGSGSATLDVHSGILNAITTVLVQDSNVIARIPWANAPYGVAASSGGVVYVTPILGPAVRRINMSTFAFSDSIQVGGNPAQVAFATTATALVTKRASGSVGIIDVATHTQTDTIAIPGAPYPIRISSDGSTAYVSSNAGWLYKINIASKSLIDSVSAPDPSLQLALGPGDSLIYVSGESAGTVTEIRTSTMSIVRTFTTGGTPQGLAVAQDGSELYIADEAGPLRIWSLSTGTQVDTVATGGSTFGVALSSDGTRLFVGTTAGSIFLVNRLTRAIIHHISVGGTPRNIAVDPVTGYAIVPNEAGNWIDIVK